MTRPLTALFRFVPRPLLLAAVLVVAVSPAGAQHDAAERGDLVEAIYPVMIAALEAKQFGRARNICDQVIMWEPQNPVHHYNPACIEAQAGGNRIPYALGALDLAAALGFSDAAHLQADPDLKPLRGDPKFAEIARRVVHNATAGDAISSLAIPPARPTPPVAPPAASDDRQPAPHAVRAGMPVGLYWLSRYHAETRALEQAVWYFAPDGTVYRNLEHGYSPAELAAHAGPRGRASADNRTLQVRWLDGTTSSGPLERDPTGFTWDMAIFSIVEAFGHPSEVPGVYAGGGVLPGDDIPVVFPQRLTLRANGTFVWEGVAFRPTAGASSGRPVSAADATPGRWELQGYSLTLIAESGLRLRRFAFPDDDNRTVLKPDRLFFGGLMLKRQP